ncbi:hypothetical protein EVAR_91439_1 [Eumeta japonica]|uniref:Uncharacterized protein n=1 Tax=Eumeta variegata TaxID=151549 RepID=A0A4C1X3B8_EUMVA|nr:hypothetical protein EVAR_91439_1 [Eumeta japonica]
MTILQRHRDDIIMSRVDKVIVPTESRDLGHLRSSEGRHEAAKNDTHYSRCRALIQSRHPALPPGARAPVPCPPTPLGLILKKGKERSTYFGIGDGGSGTKEAILVVGLRYAFQTLSAAIQCGHAASIIGSFGTGQTRG